MNEFRRAALVDADLTGRTVRGYAAVYDSPWNDRLVEEMGYVETLARGAFRKALGRSRNVPLLWQHERRDMLATTGAGTLRLKEDGRGLAFEADLPDNPLGEYVRSMVARGDVQGMSYGIQSRPEDSVITQVNGKYQRRINDVHRLLDVSLTYEPSYEEATVELRSTGFAALPLQEILGGVGAQTEEAAEEDPPYEATLLENTLRARERALRIGILEQGGILLCGTTSSNN